MENGRVCLLYTSVLYFGRFSEEKGIGTLIKVCKELPDVQFIFAGTGPLEESIKEMCIRDSASCF